MCSHISQLLNSGLYDSLFLGSLTLYFSLFLFCCGLHEHRVRCVLLNSFSRNKSEIILDGLESRSVRQEEDMSVYLLSPLSIPYLSLKV